MFLISYHHPHHWPSHHSRVGDRRDTEVQVLAGMRSPFSRRILDRRIPKCLEKPPKLDSYKCMGDLDEHVHTMFDYYHPCGIVKCKLFVLTLKGVVITWFKTLPDSCINSWKELYVSFTTQITARKQKPTTIVVLTMIYQKKKETLR